MPNDMEQIRTVIELILAGLACFLFRRLELVRRRLAALEAAQELAQKTQHESAADLNLRMQRVERRPAPQPPPLVSPPSAAPKLSRGALELRFKVQRSRSQETGVSIRPPDS